MPTLTDLIQIIPPDVADEPEDIFASASGLIFTDDLRNFHGDPGSTIIYKSLNFGDIELSTADPTIEDERQLFSHYLWNAGIKLASLISAEDSEWSVRGEKVLELGAGVGLNGIVATLVGAQDVVMTDYPSEVVLANIRQNAKRNIPPEFSDRYHIQGHEWGDLASPFALKYTHSFSRILAADCYWMSSQHVNLARSMLHFLTWEPDGRIFMTSGFHTGRAKLAAFFDVATEEGVEVESIYEEDANGVKREWASEKDGGREDPTERKRWLVVATLTRRIS